ncbi:UNVERIFIED_CONTAM: hypothetical protein GTU68_057865, partial [Idotea baltica]|nr:hypothetical protein [Idotea baltica]
MQSIHPFIIVTNIESGYLEALLNFMYNGEVNVLHEMLPGLIKAAEILKIKGLAVPDEEALEKELIYAREREANIPSKETPHPPHPASSPRLSPVHRNQSVIENAPSNCIIPDDMSIHPGITVAAPTPAEAPPMDSNAYHPKNEMVEMCPIESTVEYVDDRHEDSTGLEDE